MHFLIRPYAIILLTIAIVEIFDSNWGYSRRSVTFSTPHACHIQSNIALNA